MTVDVTPDHEFIVLACDGELTPSTLLEYYCGVCVCVCVCVRAQECGM